MFLEGPLDSARLVQKSGKIYLVLKQNITEAKEKDDDLTRKCWLHQHFRKIIHYYESYTGRKLGEGVISMEFPFRIAKNVFNLF